MEPDGSVRHHVVVDLPQEQAFWAFTDLDRIKPREHNMLAVPIEQTVLEQHVGGDVYDRGVDGSICRWGRVLAFDPPRHDRVQLGHRPRLAGRHRPDAHQRGRGHLPPDGDGRTTVSHSCTATWTGTAPAGSRMRDGVDVDDGWPLYLARYQALTRGEQDSRMSKPDLMALAEEERADLLALLRGLTDDQWNAPSLCTRWRVRDVATHVVSYDELSTPPPCGTFLRGGLRTGRVNDVALDRYRDLDAVRHRRPPRPQPATQRPAEPASEVASH